MRVLLMRAIKCRVKEKTVSSFFTTAIKTQTAKKKYCRH